MISQAGSPAEHKAGHILPSQAGPEDMPPGQQVSLPTTQQGGHTAEITGQ